MPSEKCNDEHKSNPTVPHKGIYVGQTSRTLYERANEHQKSIKRYENSSFMFKHWASAHPELITAPEFDFKVVRKHKDPLSRLVHEAVKINDLGVLNSKSEWNCYRIARLTVETTESEAKKVY